MTRYERRELTHNWDEIRPLLKDSAQLLTRSLDLYYFWSESKGMGRRNGYVEKLNLLQGEPVSIATTPPLVAWRS